MHTLYPFANKSTPNARNWHESTLFPRHKAQTGTDHCFPCSRPSPPPPEPQQLCALRYPGREVHLKMETMKKSRFSIYDSFHGDSKIKDNNKRFKATRREATSLRQAPLGGKAEVVLLSVR